MPCPGAGGRPERDAGEAHHITLPQPIDWVGACVNEHLAEVVDSKELAEDVYALLAIAHTVVCEPRHC